MPGVGTGIFIKSYRRRRYLRYSDIPRYLPYMFSRQDLDRIAFGEPGRTRPSTKPSVLPALDLPDRLSPKTVSDGDPPSAPGTTVGGEPQGPLCTKLDPSALPSWWETILFAPVAVLRWLFGTRNTTKEHQSQEVTLPSAADPSPKPAQRRRSTDFYIYENWAHEHMARVHYAQCSQCNYGNGTHGNSSTRNGRWLGPFDSFDAAVEAARGQGTTTISPCRTCTPC